MVVKSKRGRRRYIAFSTTPSTNEALLGMLGTALRGAGVGHFKLIQYDGTKGIVRVGGADQKAAVEAMGDPDASPHITTLAASGTLRTLRERFFQTEGR